MDLLIIRLEIASALLPLAEQMVEWGMLRDGDLIAGPYRMPLQEIKGTLNTEALLHALLLIPGEHVLLTEVSVPSQKPKHLAKAVPYLLEEQLTEDVEALHFALLGKVENGQVSVAVMNRELLTDWLAQLKDLGIHATAMVPDVLAIPMQPQHWYLILQRQRTLLRTGEYQGLAFPGTQMPVFLDTLFEQANLAQQAIQIQLIHEMSDKVSGRILDALKLEIESAEVATLLTVNRQHIDSSCFEIMAKTLYNQQLEKKQPNLLQGAFKTKSAGLALRVNPFPLAACFAIFSVLQLGIWLGQGWYLNQRADALDQQADSFYRQHFPNAPRGLGKKKALQQLLEAPPASAQTGFINLVQVMGQQMQQLTQGNPQKMAIRSLTFRGDKSSLQVELNVEDFGLLDQLKGLIEQAGTKVTIEGATKEKDKVKARMTLSA